jgi:hypothetical protein
VLLVGIIAVVELELVLLVGIIEFPGAVLLPEGASALVEPGGTLKMLPGGNVPVLLPGFVAFPTELNSPGEVGLCTLVMGNVGSVLLPGFEAFPPGARHPKQPQP